MRAQALAVSATEWDEVWAEYDARTAPRTVAPVTMPTMARKPRAGRAVTLGIAGLLTAGASWAMAAGSALLDLAQAMERQDTTVLAAHLDPIAVQAGLRADLSRIAARAPSLEAASFLEEMAAGMADAWASASALTEVARTRGVARDAAAEGLRGTRPAGFAAVALPIATTTGAAQPMTLRVELRDFGFAPRWQVTAVEIGTAGRDSPPLRLSAR